MKIYTKLLLLFIGFLFCNSMYSQAISSQKAWDLQRCFDYATVNNINVNTLKLNEQISNQNLLLAKGSKTPELSGLATNIFTNNKSNQVNNALSHNQITSLGNYNLNSSLVLWNRNFINNNIQQKKLLQETSNLEVSQAVNTITIQITQSYLIVLLAKENLTYAIDLVNTSKEKVKQAQQLFDAGSIAKTSLLQLQAQLANDNYLQTQAENAIKQNLLVLKQLLQLPSETEFDIVTPTKLEMSNLLPSLKIVQQKASDNFPDVKIGQLGVAAAELDISKAKANFAPTLTAVAALGTSYNQTISNSVMATTPYFNQTSNNFYQNIGVNVSIPFLTNKTNKTNLEKAKINFNQANLNLQNKALILSQEIEQSYLNAQNATALYKSANEQLLSAAETYRIGNEQFKLGGNSTYDLLQLKNQYIQAFQAFTQAKYSAILDQKIVEFYNGNKIQF